MRTRAIKDKLAYATIESELKALLIEYAEENTEGNEAAAIRQILRKVLEEWKRNKE